MNAAMSSSAPGAKRIPLDWQALPARTFVDDEGIRREWDALNAGAGDIPVLASNMVAVAIMSLGCGKERLFVGRRGQAVVAMAVLTPRSRVHWASFQPSQMPLGALVAASGEALAELGASLLRSPHLNALVVSLTQLDPQAMTRGTDAPTARFDDYVQTAWIEVDGDFETYWGKRGKNLRQNLRTQRNRLGADGTSAVMRIWRDRDQMAPALARYADLETRGWKAAQGTAIEANSEQGKFYRALLETAAGHGQAVIYEYLFDSRTVAMNLCVHRGGALVILKTTYDESLKPLSPATLLLEEQMRHFFASGEFRRIEYYGRLWEWQTKWIHSNRTLFHATVYRWPILRKFAEWRRRQVVSGAAAAPAPQIEPATP